MRCRLNINSFVAEISRLDGHAKQIFVPAASLKEFKDLVDEMSFKGLDVTLLRVTDEGIVTARFFFDDWIE